MPRGGIMELYNRVESAAKMRISAVTFDRLRKQGIIKRVIKIGARIFMTDELIEEALKDMIEERTEKTEYETDLQV
jgi:predicted site-specific integrase-resolvase